MRCSDFWIDFSLFDDGLDAATAAAAAAAAAADTLPRFHRFPDLPPEIRLKIWSYLVAPRVVAACCFERDDRLPARSVPAPCKPSSSSSSSSSPACPEAVAAAGPMVFNPTCPVLLLVCRESRALGLAHYELAFSWRVPAPLAAVVARPPRAWFNFRLDALYLAGALDPRDRYGFDTPVVRFLRPRDARRVRRLACAFSALRYPERGPDPAFGCLWHVIDRFPRARRLVLAVAPRDEEAMGPCRPLTTTAAAVDDDDDHDHVNSNVVRQVWDGWVRGTTVTTARVADTQVLLVREADLADVMASHAQEDEGERRRGARQVAV
ncbi:uncharacterized protein LY79DRAFT_588219 [Colletotrichum navitas]|uniref:2EXR domain-containing protein n=1 Tax=Colletotrichum navitas TaxID=681940 RepID=A0AAD8Q6A8_9PEZI|nr:uncharacterized protein LY79DRAFT_588219 [Colletotrichum navitas]KAK1596066.1 hypothetical protein LY79DRAFT_588219 [Colletotrichum navitas]